MSKSKTKKKLATNTKNLFLSEGGGGGATISSLDAPTLIVDNGAGRIKYGWSTDDQPLGTMPNAIAKIHKTLESAVGDEIDTVPGATSQLRFSRPFDRGYLTNWNVERDIWHRMFSKHLNISPNECNLVMTIPPFCPEEIQQDTNEVLFEEMGVASALCKSAAWFSSYHYSQRNTETEAQIQTARDIDRDIDTQREENHDQTLSQFKECNVVVDSGFSFSHAMPFVNGMVRAHAVKRVNVGGKLLTNYLKEIISYRQWNFMDEFLLVNQVKDALCFVSQDFNADLTRCQLESPNMRIPRPAVVAHDDTDRGSSSDSSSVSSSSGNINRIRSNQVKKEDAGSAMCISRHDTDEEEEEDDEDEDDEEEYLRKFFVLPDFHRVMRGYVKEDGAAFVDDEQVLTMESERFTLPEVLFHPSDIGISQMGVVEATGEAIKCLREIEGELCAKNIILTGGNANLPGYKQRFQRDILQYVPQHWRVNVFLPPDPALYAWQGAAFFSRQEQQTGRFHNYAVTREEYLEEGHAACMRKFGN